MADRFPQPANIRQQLEIQLLEVLRQRQLEWIKGSEENRAIARQRFLDALDVFNNLSCRRIWNYEPRPPTRMPMPKNQIKRSAETPERISRQRTELNRQALPNKAPTQD